MEEKEKLNNNNNNKITKYLFMYEITPLKSYIRYDRDMCFFGVDFLKHKL